MGSRVAYISIVAQIGGKVNRFMPNAKKYPNLGYFWLCEVGF